MTCTSSVLLSALLTPRIIKIATAIFSERHLVFQSSLQLPTLQTPKIPKLYSFLKALINKTLSKHVIRISTIDLSPTVYSTLSSTFPVLHRVLYPNCPSRRSLISSSACLQPYQFIFSTVTVQESGLCPDFSRLPKNSVRGNNH